MTTNKEELKLTPKLNKTLETINKRFGGDSISLFGDRTKVDVEVIPTGLPSLDNILGVGGLAKGRIVELFGKEMSGKSTLALQTLAQAQKQKGFTAYIDLEHAVDPIYAANLGVDMDSILFSQPSSGEEALEIIDELVKSGEVSLVVLDSVAALSTKAELDGEMQDATVASVARLMGKAMRKLISPVSKNNCLVIFINQLRANVGAFGMAPAEITTGGKALKYAASVRLDLRSVGQIKNGEKVIGHKTRIKVVKNKLSPPFKDTDIDLIYGEGFSKEADVMEMAIQKGIINKSGAWFSYLGEQIGQGQIKVREYLKENPDVYNEIYKKIQE